MGASRKDLRRAAGTSTGEVLVLTATDVGSISAFIDEVHLIDREDNAPSLVNRIGYFSGGTAENLGREVRITAFNKSTKALTFLPEVATTPQPGDQFELWSNWQRFGGIEAVHLLINEAIRSVETFTGPQVYDTAQAFTWSSPEIDIPTTWCEFGGADRRDRYGLWKTIPPAQLHIRKGLRTVEIKGKGRDLARSKNVRLWGYEPAPFLEADDDETDVDAEWLIKTVSSAMRLGLSWRSSDRPAEERLADFWDGKATELRRKLGFSRPGMGMSLPFTRAA